jgi:glycosyltransferase involved in cell wall biosynthesis
MTVSIIVPCKNEENNIKIVLDSIEKIGKKTEVLFGNDNSEDNTEGEIKKFINKRKDINIIYYEGPGICKANNVYKGFEIATGDILVIHDADNTVHPIELKKIVKILVEKNQNMVIGTRLIYPMEKKAMKFSNYLGNLFFSYFYSLILQQKVTDTLCGTKAIFKKDWGRINRYIGKWGIKDKWGDFELLSGAKINMMRISEVPVNYKERVQGETKMTNTVFNGLRMLLICVVSFIKIRIK